MMVVFVVVVVVAYALAASWAAQHGRGRLWLTAAGFLLLVVVSGVLLGRHYSVPSLPRLILYVVALTGPIVAIPTTMLSRAATTKSTMMAALPTAILGACIGLVCGFVIVVFGLKVW